MIRWLVLVMVNFCLAWDQGPPSYDEAMRSGERVRLEDVDVISLTKGSFTRGRRSHPIPQLKCVGGSGRWEKQPESVQCYNRGSDGREVQWECKADMDNGLKFGQLQVACEGYDYPGDPYILSRSCGLEYFLELTEEGRDRKNKEGGGGGARRSGGGRGGGGGWSNTRSDKTHTVSYEWSGLGDFLWYVMVGFILLIICCCCCGSKSKVGDREGGDSAGVGGGGWVKPEGAETRSHESNTCNNSEDTGFGAEGARYRGRDGAAGDEGDDDESSGRRTASGFGGTTIR